MILALDISSARCSVALLGDDVCAQAAEEVPRQHHQRVLPIIDALLQANARRLADVSRYALGNGPGSFTGLRIATGIIQGLAFGTGKPVVCVSSLRALAASAWRQIGDPSIRYVLTVVDAHMNEMYWGCYRVEGELPVALFEDRLGAPNSVRLPDGVTVEQTLLVADQGVVSAMSMPRTPRVHTTFPQALDVARIAAGDASLPAVSADAAQPVYLRGLGAWKTLAEQGRLEG